MEVIGEKVGEDVAYLTDTLSSMTLVSPACHPERTSKVSCIR